METPDGPLVVNFRESEGLQERSPALTDISAVINSLKKRVSSDRHSHIERRTEENRQKIFGITVNNFMVSLQIMHLAKRDDTRVDLLAKRQKDAIELKNGILKSYRDNTGIRSSSFREGGHGSAPVLSLGSVEPIKLPEVKRPPPSTTWTFLDRNRRMTDDQSVFGRKRIYYEQSGGEALVASESDDEEVIVEDEKKREFVESEDYILRRTIKKVGFCEAALDALAQCFSRKPCEVKARYEVLIQKENAAGGSHNNRHGEATTSNSSLVDKENLNAALDSFDNLFCRRCLLFDCKLHGWSQDLIFPAEKQLPWSCPPDKEENLPCGLYCYRLVINPDGRSTVSSATAGSVGPSSRRREKTAQSQSATSNARNVSESIDLASGPPIHGLPTSHASSAPPKAKLCENLGIRKRNNTIRFAEHVAETLRKNHKKKKNNNFQTNSLKESEWKTIEKELFQKGVEIFGRKSCLIARNLMNGAKTCSEVFQFMNCPENNNNNNNISSEAAGNNGPYSLAEGCSKGDDGNEENMGTQIRRRSRLFRRKGRRVRRLKYTWKPTHRSKRNSEKKLFPQYNPCGCQSATCGKDCICLLNKTCCEKYCGCPRSCKNRFRGCHCTKSQCRSRQCPCFAEKRECDPDVCRNCWISCGDGTLGTPGESCDNYECMNMKVLLKQHQKVLLGRSDVSGWGAFAKNNIAKNEYLGEYTGELISHREADMRGKIYDRVNSSFLFNLNEQYVVDAYRKGNKLKFANHSSDPNCIAKVFKVAGDHRVAIFSKRQINAGEELFYDYCHTAEATPAWLKKLKEEASGSKKPDHNTPSTSRAKKNAQP